MTVQVDLSAGLQTCHGHLGGSLLQAQTVAVAQQDLGGTGKLELLEKSHRQIAVDEAAGNIQGYT